VRISQLVRASAVAAVLAASFAGPASADMSYMCFDVPGYSMSSPRPVSTPGTRPCIPWI
jgi:hypothetical protein